MSSWNLALLLAAVLAGWQVDAKPEIPSIWNSQVISEQSYHLLAEIQLPNLGKSYLVEEWASVPHRAFRFDSLDETETGRRRSILSLNETGELFRFEPFECQLLQYSNLMFALPLEVSDQFVSRNNKSAYSYVVTGVGSLWLYATEHPNPKFNERSRPPSKNRWRLYDSYYFEPTEEFAYGLRFYFEEPDDPTTILAVEITDTKSPKRSSVVMRICIQRSEFPYLGYNYEDDSSFEWTHDEVFSIPLGYGCQRGGNFHLDEHLKLIYFVAPPDALLTRSKPVNRMLRLEAIVSQPSSDSQDLESWLSRSISMRVLFGEIEISTSKTHKYMVLESAQYEPGTRNNMTANMQRQRQVWVLGEQGFKEKSTKEKSIQYWIDERSGQCIGRKEGHGLRLLVDFTQPSTVTPEYRMTNPERLRGLDMDMIFIELLFGPHDGFHLLRQDTDLAKGLLHLVYEISIGGGQLVDMDLSRMGSQISIIRKHTIPQASSPDKLRLNEMESSSTVYLYNSNRSRQIAQIHVNLREVEPIFSSDLHEAIDISPCYQNPDSPRPIGFTLDLDLKFESLEDKNQEPSVSPSLFGTRKARASVKRRFLMALNDAPVPVDLQQVVALEVNPSSLGEKKIRLSGRLLDRPPELDFDRKPMTAMAQDKYRNLFNQIAESALECAHRCSHLNCRAFDYCQIGPFCSLMVESPDMEQPPISLEFNSSCEHYERRARLPFADALQFAQELKQSIEMGPDRGWLKPLRLYGRYYDEQKGQWLGSRAELRPSSIRFDTDRFDNSIQGADSRTDPQTDQNDQPSKLAETPKPVPFMIVANSARFQVSTRLPDDKFPFRLQSDLSPEQCESLCSELDCGSFAYCSLDKSCMLSLLHKTHEIEQYLEREQPFCTVLGLNYLTKFRRTWSKQESKAPDIPLEHLTAWHERDCANACIESGNKCLSFYFCRRQEAATMSDCYLSPIRISDRALEVTSIKPTESYPCDAYSRSYLIEFTRHYNKQLPTRYVYEEMLMRSEASAELCASQCAQADRCTGFMVCRNRGIPICTLAKANGTLQVNELEPSDTCSSFVLAPGAQLNRAPKLELLEEVELPVSLMPSPVDVRYQSHWFLVLFIFIVGGASGYSVALLVANAR